MALLKEIMREKESLKRVFLNEDKKGRERWGKIREKGMEKCSKEMANLKENNR
ncbi:MAG: hypothetical protein WC774_05440 [Candidatus Gracilibacteria bacterium]